MPTTTNYSGCTDCCGLDVACCPDDPIPGTLTASDGTNSMTLTWDSGSSWWQGTAASFVGCTDVTITLACDETFGMWGCTITAASPPPVDAQPFSYSLTCDPFLLVFDPPAGCGTTNYTITITA